jgi:hypothetical protein
MPAIGRSTQQESVSGNKGENKMPRRLLFSLPVHERPDIVRGQLENLRQFCPHAVICLHISTVATGDIEPFMQLGRLPGVLVNPERFTTQQSKGLFHVHAMNFRYALQCYPEIDSVALVSSNELLVRSGLEEHVAKYQAGAQIEIFDREIDWHLFNRQVENDPAVREVLRHFGLTTIFGGQAEGQFYNAAVFSEMVSVFLRFFPLSPSWFETEEILPQTMAIALLQSGKPVVLPFTFQNYTSHINVDQALVNLIRTGYGFIFSPRRRGCLRSPHIAIHDLSSVFSVKRVPREECAIRSYIYGLDHSQSPLV